jgi:hypothetical protein
MICSPAVRSPRSLSVKDTRCRSPGSQQRACRTSICASPTPITCGSFQVAWAATCGPARQMRSHAAPCAAPYLSSAAASAGGCSADQGCVCCHRAIQTGPSSISATVPRAPPTCGAGPGWCTTTATMGCRSTWRAVSPAARGMGSLPSCRSSGESSGRRRSYPSPPSVSRGHAL